MFKVNNKNSGTTPRVSIIEFEQVNISWERSCSLQKKKQTYVRIRKRNQFCQFGRTSIAYYLLNRLKLAMFFRWPKTSRWPASVGPNRSSHPKCSIKNASPKNFSIFTWKHLCWNLLLKTLQARRPATLLIRDSNTSVFQWILRKF